MNASATRAIPALFALGLGLTLVSGPLLAQDPVAYRQAQVISSTPIFEVVRVPTSREACWDEEVRYRRPGGNPGASLIGGVIGGAVGRQFGGGSGKDALTALGAIVGASVANQRADRRRGDFTRVERRCRVADEYYEEERITGYHVRYEFDGRVYSTRTVNDPGETLDVRVAVTPVGH